MALNDLIVKVQLNLDFAKEHVGQLEAGKKASAPKARTALQNIKVLAHELRKACIVSQKSIPVKSRTKVAPIEPVVEVPAPEPEPVAEAEPVAVAPVKKPRKLKSSN